MQRMFRHLLTICFILMIFGADIQAQSRTKKINELCKKVFIASGITFVSTYILPHFLLSTSNMMNLENMHHVMNKFMESMYDNKTIGADIRTFMFVFLPALCMGVSGLGYGITSFQL